jgi:hypothetical protein
MARQRPLSSVPQVAQRRLDFCDCFQIMEGGRAGRLRSSPPAETPSPIAAAQERVWAAMARRRYCRRNGKGDCLGQSPLDGAVLRCAPERPGTTGSAGT